MIELLLIYIVMYILVYIMLFFIAGLGYLYWALSIGMAPVLWILMGIGAIAGFFGAIKNAFKAMKAVRGKGVK
jgi:hypothetical protein